MNSHEIERIACAMNRLRPDWPEAQLRTLLREKLNDRPRRDVCVALAWIACESNSATPYRVVESGPWWKAAAVEGRTAPRNPFDKSANCATCSLAYDKCRQVWADDHEYVSVVEHEKHINRDPERIRRILESVRSETAPMRTPDPLAAEKVVELNHDECEREIAAAMSRGDSGRAEYLSNRCDRAHGDLTTTPTDPPRDLEESNG